MSESKVGGLCTYCALLCCTKCKTLDHFCHGHEFGRTVCSYHSKNNKAVVVNNNRVLAYIGTDENRSVNHKNKNLSILTPLSSLFKIFYNELDSCAHYFDIFDYRDITLWAKSIKCIGIYVFVTSEAADRALINYKDLVTLKRLNEIDSLTINTNNNGVVNLQLCSQCNGYQAKFPEPRVQADFTSLPAKNRLLIPNFYSDSLCRKPNISHEKKKKGGRLKNLAELQSSLDLYREEGHSEIIEATIKSCTNQTSNEVPDSLPIIPITAKSDLKQENNLVYPDASYNASTLNFNKLPVTSPVNNFNNIVSISPFFSSSTSSAITPKSPSFDKFSESSYVSPFFEYASTLLRGMSPFRRPLTRDTMHLPIVIGNNADHAPSKQEFNMLKDVLNAKPNDNIYPRTDSKTPIRKDLKRKTENEANGDSKITKLNNDSHVSDNDDSKISYLKYPKTEVLITLSESHDMNLFYAYFRSYPVNPTTDPSRFIRYELLHLNALLTEAIDIDCVFASPALPLRFDQEVKISQLYYLKLPSSNVQDYCSLYRLSDSLKYSPEGPECFSNRSKVFTSLMTSIEDISPFLMNSDSIVSKIEPLLFLLYRFLYLNLTETLNFDFGKCAQNLDKYIKTHCAVLIEAYSFYNFVLNNGARPDLILVIKNLILCFLMYISLTCSRVRFLGLRSAATIKALAYKRGMLASTICIDRDAAPDPFDIISDFCDCESLESQCMSDDYQYLNTTKILQHILYTSVASDEYFSLNVDDITSICTCSFLKEDCKHTKRTNNLCTKVNFCIPVHASHALMQIGYDVGEEYYTRIYVDYLKKICDCSHISFDNISGQLTENVLMPKHPLNALIASLNFGNLELHNDSYRNLRGSPMTSNFFNHATMLVSNISSSTIASPCQDKIDAFHNSLPIGQTNYLGPSSKLEEAIIWYKLAVKLAFSSKDFFAICFAYYSLINSYFFWTRDYIAALVEADIFINYLYDCIPHFQSACGKTHERNFSQSLIIRLRSIIYQYKCHVAAGLKTVFYPGQLLTINIDNIPTEVVYFSYEYFGKPMYLANIQGCGGDCWAVRGCDLSLLDSWRSVALDNLHTQASAASQPLMCQRFMLQTFRSGEYAVNLFKNDILSRGNVIATL